MEREWEGGDRVWRNIISPDERRNPFKHGLSGRVGGKCVKNGS